MEGTADPELFVSGDIHAAPGLRGIISHPAESDTMVSSSVDSGSAGSNPERIVLEGPAGGFQEGFGSVEVRPTGARMSDSWKRHATRYLEEFGRFVGKTHDQLLQNRLARKRKDSRAFHEEALLNL